MDEYFNIIVGLLVAIGVIFPSLKKNYRKKNAKPQAAAPKPVMPEGHKPRSARGFLLTDEEWEKYKYLLDRPADSVKQVESVGAAPPEEGTPSTVNYCKKTSEHESLSDVGVHSQLHAGPHSGKKLDLDPKKMILYSEILRPKYSDEKF